jgi:hypothetical protein
MRYIQFLTMPLLPSSLVLFGLIWGLLIFNLDRFIVSTIKKRHDFFAEIIQASSRILWAIIIAIVI